MTDPDVIPQTIEYLKDARNCATCANHRTSARNVPGLDIQSIHYKCIKYPLDWNPPRNEDGYLRPIGAILCPLWEPYDYD